MENLICNELRLRELDVDIGIVTADSKDIDGKSKRTLHEVDFVANHFPSTAILKTAYFQAHLQNIN